MAQWLGRVSQGCEKFCHDQGVVCSNPSRIGSNLKYLVLLSKLDFFTKNISLFPDINYIMP